MSEIIDCCSICGKLVTKDESYSNQHKNIMCTSCVRLIAESLDMNEALYVMNYIQNFGTDQQKLFHAMIVILNRARRVGDDSVNLSTIGLKCKDYLKEAYDLTDDEAMSIVSQNLAVIY